MRSWGITFMIGGVLALILPRFGWGLFPFVFFGQYYTETSIASIVIGALMFGASYAMGPSAGGHAE